MHREPGKSVLAAYGSLAFPLAAAFIALQVFVPTFYAESTGLSLTAIGIVMLIAKTLRHSNRSNSRLPVRPDTDIVAPT